MKSKHLLLALVSTLSVFAAAAPARAVSFSNVDITFDEPAFFNDPDGQNWTDNTDVTGGTFGFNVLDNSGAKLTDVPAPAGDFGDDITISFSESGVGGQRTSAPSGRTPRNFYDRTSTNGRFRSVQSFDAPPGSAPDDDASLTQDLLISTTTQIDFANHLEITDLSLDLSSINTAGVTWEYTAIEFLDASGNPFTTAFNQATDVGNYNTFNTANSGGISGQLRQGIYLAASTGTVTPANGGALASTGSNGPDNDATISAADVGIPAGTQIGGVRFTTFQEDVRGPNNADSNFTATIEGFNISGEAVPEPFTILGSIAALGFGGVLRKKLKGEAEESEA